MFTCVFIVSDNHEISSKTFSCTIDVQCLSYLNDSKYVLKSKLHKNFQKNYISPIQILWH